MSRLVWVVGYAASIPLQLAWLVIRSTAPQPDRTEP